MRKNRGRLDVIGLPKYEPARCVQVQRKRKHKVTEMAEEFPLVLVAFDFLYADEKDLLGETYARTETYQTVGKLGSGLGDQNWVKLRELPDVARVEERSWESVSASASRTTDIWPLGPGKEF